MNDLETRLTRASTRIVEPEAARCDRGREAAMAWAAGEPTPRRSRSEGRRRRIVTVVAPTVAVGAIAAIAVFGLGTRSDEVVPERTVAVSSDEVSLERIAAAVDPGDRIEHSRWVDIGGRPIEQWSRRGGVSVITDPTNLLQEPSTPVASPPICSMLSGDGPCRTVGEALSVMIRSGNPEVVGRVIDGNREVIRIRVDPTMTIRGVSGTVDVDPDTLLLVGVDLSIPAIKERARYRYEIYEFLPPTEENLALFRNATTP